ncbi:MAG: Protein translocase subunit [Symbiobacteriaceae bacterium]|jgi:preprotein translocase subunit SecF|nr:Protein translocase subunit [Symbiobacteriaceae bacterium]
MGFLTRINYMRSAKYWLVFSLVLSLVSLGALGFMGLNLGIDFTGGKMLDVQYKVDLTNAQVEDAVHAVVGQNASVQEAQMKGGETGSEWFIRTPELSEADRTKLLDELKKNGEYTIISEDDVSGAVSSELATKAGIALAIAALLQIIYVWFRFEFKFGITAVLALVHDLIITLGLLALMRVQINSTFVAAILTVLGYSMNDTIVVIDRIRENLKFRKKGETLEEMTTRSIQEVITRSLYTGVSVQAMLISMLVFGGDTIWDFAMTLLIGVTAGTYSSIFIASALWLFWHQWEDQRKKKLSGKPSRA